MRIHRSEFHVDRPFQIEESEIPTRATRQHASSLALMPLGWLMLAVAERSWLFADVLVLVGTRACCSMLNNPRG